MHYPCSLQNANLPLSLRAFNVKCSENRLEHYAINIAFYPVLCLVTKADDVIKCDIHFNAVSPTVFLSFISSLVG